MVGTPQISKIAKTVAKGRNPRETKQGVDGGLFGQSVCFCVIQLPQDQKGGGSHRDLIQYVRQERCPVGLTPEVLALKTRIVIARVRVGDMRVHAVWPSSPLQFSP